MPDLKSELSKLTDLKFDDEPNTQPEAAVVAFNKPKLSLDTPITSLDLTVRAMNVLRDYRITTVRLLLARTERDLLRLKGLGAKSVKEIVWLLSSHDLALGETPDEIKSLQERVWDFVKSHPGCTARDVGVHFNMNTKQPSARLFQLFKSNAVTREQMSDGSFRWYAPMETYPVRPVGHAVAAAHAARRGSKSSPAATVELKAEPTRKKIDINTVLDTLSVVEARHLYDELKKIFGA